MPDARKKERSGIQEEQRELLNDRSGEYRVQCGRRRNLLSKIVAAVQILGMVYVSIGLLCFAVGLFLRTQTYLALLGPIAVFGIVLVSSEYYNMKRKGCLARCEKVVRSAKMVFHSSSCSNCFTSPKTNKSPSDI